MVWKISLVGTFDRFNYGDVLFANVVDHRGPRRLSGMFLWIHHRTRYPLWQHMFRRKNPHLWMSDARELPSGMDPEQVVYSAVGSVYKQVITWQAEALKRASCLTVRDASAAKAVAGRELTAPPTVPDSAVTMADLVSEKTHLRGYITAFVFQWARVGLEPSVKKVAGFRDAWDSPDMPAGQRVEAIADSVDQALAAAPQTTPDATIETYKASFAAMLASVGAVS